MPFCQTHLPRLNRPPDGDAQTRAERYRRLALAETDPARAKILWQLVEDAQRKLLCTSDDSLQSRPVKPSRPA